MSPGEPVNPARTTQSTSTNPEPSPDDDVIVVTSVASYCRIGTRWWRVGPYGKDTGPYAWTDIAGDPSARIYVHASRLAAVEAELAEARAETIKVRREKSDAVYQWSQLRASLERVEAAHGVHPAWKGYCACGWRADTCPTRAALADTAPEETP